MMSASRKEPATSKAGTNQRLERNWPAKLISLVLIGVKIQTRRGPMSSRFSRVFSGKENSSFSAFIYWQCGALKALYYLESAGNQIGGLTFLKLFPHSAALPEHI